MKIFTALVLSLAMTSACYAKSNQTTSAIVSVSSYSLNASLWAFAMGNGKGWTTIRGDFQSFQMTLNPKMISGQKCGADAPTLVLNFTKINETQTRVQVDASTVFYGRSLQQLFAGNQKTLQKGETNIFDFEAIAVQSLGLFALNLKFNTNPRDEEDFGKISLVIDDGAVKFSAYDGDDDGGQRFTAQGMNTLKVTCSDK
jgi:hypothetical protein